MSICCANRRSLYTPSDPFLSFFQALRPDPYPQVPCRRFLDIPKMMALLRNSILANMFIISFHHREHRAHRGAKRAFLCFFSVSSVLSVVADPYPQIPCHRGLCGFKFSSLSMTPRRASGYVGHPRDRKTFCLAPLWQGTCG